MASRVVITGIGAVSPLGLTVDEMWDGLVQGKNGIDTIKSFDPAGFGCKLAGEVPEYKIRDFVPKSFRKATKLMCRDIELAVMAAKEAVESSGIVTKGIDPENVNIDPRRFAINLGAGMISCDLIELAPAIAQSLSDGKFDIRKWGSDGLNMVTPLWLLKYLPNMLACHISIIHDIQGPSNSITCAEAGGHIAISEATSVISRGNADIAIAGGAEAKVNPILMARQELLKRSTTENDPAKAFRPFDGQAKGGVFGEGAGMVLLENADTAKQRGAKVYAEIVGFGSGNSLNDDYEHLESSGEGLSVAIEAALHDAGIDASELDLIIPHGIGVAQDDAAEACGIEKALGSAVDKVIVWPTKSMLSITGAASGGLDVIAAVKCIETGIIPATRNFSQAADSCKLNISKETIKKDIKYVLSCSYTFGGQTAAVILKKTDE